MQIGSPRIDESRLHYSRTSSRTYMTPLLPVSCDLVRQDLVMMVKHYLPGSSAGGSLVLRYILYGRGKCIALVLFALTGLFRQHMALYSCYCFVCLLPLPLFRRSDAGHRTPAYSALLVLALGLHITPQLVMFTRSRTQITRCGVSLRFAVLLSKQCHRGDTIYNHL